MRDLRRELLRRVHAGDLHVAAERDRRRSPYSVSPLRTLRSIGGKNSEKRSTRMPTALAAAKWPNSCRMISAAKPAKASEPAHRARPPPRPARAATRAGLARRPRRATRTRARARRGSCSSVRLDHRRRCRGTPSRPSRNAWTATSLAALSTHGAVPPASAASRARPQARERVVVDGLEGQRADARRGRAADRARRRARGGAARRRSARACPGWPRCASAAPSRSCDERVDDRLRVHDDVDALVGHPEQVVGLDHLEALVHQRRRVDRDLAAHRPRRVRERLLDASRLRARRAMRPRNGPPEAVIDEPLDRARRLAGDQLVQRRVLGVDRHAAARRSPRRAASRARRRRRATPCWPARGRCPRRASRPSARARPSRRAR